MAKHKATVDEGDEPLSFCEALEALEALYHRYLEAMADDLKRAMMPVVWPVMCGPLAAALKQFGGATWFELDILDDEGNAIEVIAVLDEATGLIVFNPPVMPPFSTPPACEFEHHMR